MEIISLKGKGMIFLPGKQVDFRELEITAHLLPWAGFDNSVILNLGK